MTENKNKKTIQSLRSEVDQLHKQLFGLLLRRKELTEAIWEIKKNQGEEFYDSDREEKITHEFLKLYDLESNSNVASGEAAAFKTLLKNIMTSVLKEYQTYLRSQFSNRGP